MRLDEAEKKKRAKIVLKILNKIYPKSNKIILNTEFLSSGFYFLNLKSKNGEQIVKFLINND